MNIDGGRAVELAKNIKREEHDSMVGAVTKL